MRGEDPGTEGGSDSSVILPDADASGQQRGDIETWGDLEMRAGDAAADAWTPKPCQSHDDCPGGYCVEAVPESEEYVCTVTCIEECPLDWVCKSVFIQGPDPVSVCLPPSDTLCKVCQTDAACLLSGSLCIKSGGGLGFCGRQCDPDAAECPEGFECVLYSDGEGDPLGHQCMPLPGNCCVSGGVVTCDDDKPCTFDGCSPAAGCTHEPFDAECSGDDPCMEYLCVGGECVGTPVTIDDTLDHIDNDCDGLTDEEAYKEFRLVGGQFVSGGGFSEGAGLACSGELGAPPIDGESKGLDLIVRAGLLWLWGN